MTTVMYSAIVADLATELPALTRWQLCKFTGPLLQTSYKFT